MPYNIGITGASGFLGQLLTHFLRQEGHHILPISHEELIRGYIPDSDIIIHLAGLNIAKSFWTKSFKRDLFNSRVDLTKLLMKRLPARLQLFISASSIGYYGDRGEEIVTESSAKGSGFLSDLTEAWEKASEGIPCRRVLLRIAPVISAKGGLLRSLLPAFRKSLGAIFGGGNHYMSWIHARDFARAVSFIIESRLDGPVILAAPEAIRQRQFAKTLSKKLKSRLFLRLPAWLFKLLPGDMGKELFLYSTRAFPEKLLDNGFQFVYPELEEALEGI